MTQSDLSGWTVSKAKEFCLSVRDGTHDSPKFVEAGYPLVTSKHLKDGELNLDSAELISQSDFDEINKRSKVDQWDVIFTMIGTIGEVYLVAEEDPKFAIKNVGLFKCGSQAKAKWLYYWFKNPATRREILQVRRGASQQYIPLGSLRDLEIKYPACEAVMLDIVGRGAALDDLIENNRRRIALLEQSARLLYREWFVHLRFPGHEHVKVVDGVPEGWTRSSVSELATLAGGKQYESGKLTDAGAYPVFGGNGIQGYAHEKTHDDFVIAFGRVGAYCGSVHWSYEGAWINNNASSLVPHEYPELFLHHMLHCDFRNYRKGAAQPFIPNGVLSTICFIGPSRMLAAEFCEQVRSMRLQQIILAKQNKKLAQARDLLLPRLMSGDLVV